MIFIRDGWIGVTMTKDRGVGWVRIERIVSLTDRGLGDGANIEYEAGGEVWQIETNESADDLIDAVMPQKKTAARKPAQPPKATQPPKAAQPRPRDRPK